MTNAIDLTIPPDGQSAFPFLVSAPSIAAALANLYTVNVRNSAEQILPGSTSGNLNCFGAAPGEWALICGGIGWTLSWSTPKLPNAEGAFPRIFSTGDREDGHVIRAIRSTDQCGDFDIFTSTLGEDRTRGAIARDNYSSATSIRDTRNAILRDGQEMLVPANGPGFRPEVAILVSCGFHPHLDDQGMVYPRCSCPISQVTEQDTGPCIFFTDGNEVLLLLLLVPQSRRRRPSIAARALLPTERARNIEADAEVSSSATINPAIIGRWLILIADVDHSRIPLESRRAIPPWARTRSGKSPPIIWN
jgi:hypothetical protein